LMASSATLECTRGAVPGSEGCRTLTPLASLINMVRCGGGAGFEELEGSRWSLFVSGFGAGAAALFGSQSVMLVGLFSASVGSDAVFPPASVLRVRPAT